MERKHYYIRDGRIRLLKPNINIAEYEAKHPEARKVTGHPPTIHTMETWVSNGIARATDGCRVEPDGTCQHGHDSWLKVLGYI